MLRLLADENLNGDVTRGLRLSRPGLDIVRIQDVGLGNADDTTVLAWAAEQNRVVVTHDVATMVGFAYQRVRAGQPMPGLIEVPRHIAVGLAIEELLLVAEGTLEGELEGQVVYLPL